jgi:hypothetical protein
VGCRLHAADTNCGHLRCFCGEEIEIRTMGAHLQFATVGRCMIYAEPWPYADPRKSAARRILEIANSVKPMQDGASTSRRSTGPFLFQDKGSPAEYGAGMKLAIDRGWLMKHESGTLVCFTPGRRRPLGLLSLA